MADELRVSGVRLVPSTAELRRAGHWGWVSCVLNDRLALDGLSLRVTVDGRPTVTFPERKDAHGNRHPLIRPLGHAARREIERQIFAALGVGESGEGDE